MRIIKFLLFGLVLSILSACGAVEQVKNTVTYTTEAVDYAKDMYVVTEKVPQLLEQAATDEVARKELVAQLVEAKSDMEEFNELTPPSALSDVHLQIVEKNESMLTLIDEYLPLIESGKISAETFKEFPIVEEIQKIQSMIDEIKNFGN